MTGQESNTSELNRKSLKALKALGLQPEPGYPYSIQLAEWALESLELKGPWAQFQRDLLEQVRVMYGWKNPEKYLLDPEDQTAPSSSSPQALVSELLENLYENLQKVRPELRTGES